MKYIRIVLIYIIIFQILNDSLVVAYFGEYALKFNFLIFILVNVKDFFSIKYSLVINRYFLLLIISFLISFLVNMDSFIDIATPIFLIISVFASFVIFSQQKNVKHIFFALIISALVSSFYCILREDTITQWTFRKSGGMQDPNEFSTSILVVLGLVWALFIIHKKRLILVAGLSIIFALGLLFAGSKTALFVFTILTLVFLLQLIKTYKGIDKIKTTFLVLSLFAISFAFIGFYFFELIEMFLLRFESNSTGNARVDTWVAGMTIFKNNFIFGVGPSNFANTLSFTRPSLPDADLEVHNMFLKILYESGIFGFILFALFFKNIISKVIKAKSILIILMSLPLLLMGLSLPLIFDKYTWLIIGLAANPYIIYYEFYEKRKNSRNYTPTKFRRSRKVRSRSV